MRQELEGLRHAASKGDSHGRTPEIVANLALGLKYVMEFALRVAAVSSDEAEALWQRGWSALVSVGQTQIEHQVSDEPAARFVELVTSALASGRAHMAGPDGDAPANPAAWGWRQVSTGSSDHWQPQGDRIGWVDQDDVLLDPSASYRAAQLMSGNNGDGLSIPVVTLRKRLDEKGMVVRARKGELLSPRTLEGRQRKVLHLAGGILSVKATKSTISTSTVSAGRETP
jgi:hypothetical protein